MVPHQILTRWHDVGDYGPSKGRWANLSSSENFKAITLISIFGKLLDFIILIKEVNSICTSDLQLSFKMVLPPVCVLAWCRKLCLIMCIMVLMFMDFSEMLAKLLIELIIVSYSDYCLTEAFVLCTVSRFLLNMYTNKKIAC